MARARLFRVAPTLLILAVQAAAAAQTPAVVPAPPSMAAPAEIPPALGARIRAALKERIPKLTVVELHNTQLPGVYEVLSPDGITYTDAGANYVMMGQLIETQTHRNLTQDSWLAFNHVDFASLPLSLAIKWTRGSGARQIAVFADPQCPYCQELEADLAKLDDITVYTFLYPLEDLHPGATERAHQIWCAADRQAAWTTWMRKREIPAAAAHQCTGDPIKQLAALGEKLHIETTPTIIFRSGLRATGLPSAGSFVQLLDKESAPAGSAAVPHAPPGL